MVLAGAPLSRRQQGATKGDPDAGQLRRGRALAAREALDYRHGCAGTADRSGYAHHSDRQRLIACDDGDGGEQAGAQRRQKHLLWKRVAASQDHQRHQAHGSSLAEDDHRREGGPARLAAGQEVACSVGQPGGEGEDDGEHARSASSGSGKAVGLHVQARPPREAQVNSQGQTGIDEQLQRSCRRLHDPVFPQFTRQPPDGARDDRLAGLRTQRLRSAIPGTSAGQGPAQKVDR